MIYYLLLMSVSNDKGVTGINYSVCNGRDLQIDINKFPLRGSGRIPAFHKNQIMSRLNSFIPLQ